MTRRLAVAACLAVATFLGGALPAGAHAELEETSPRAGETLSDAPAEVVLKFTEPVDAVPGGVRVYDAQARRIDRGGPILEEGRGEAVLLDLPPLQDGAYIVTWRVASADSHPVRGAFTFRVGKAPGREPRALAARLLAADGGNQVVGGLHALARFFELAGLLVLVGALWFVVTLWPPGAVQRQAATLIGLALVVGVVSALALLALQGPYSGGLGLGSALDPQLLGAVVETRFGWSVISRLALLASTSFLVSRIVRPAGPSGRRLVGRATVGVLGVGLLATVTSAGHAASGRWVPLGVAADVLHLAAGALWLGGLMVAMAMLRGRASDGHEAAAAVQRFSKTAFWAVLVLIATGALQSLRQVGEPAALAGTTYGRVLLIKLAAFAGMVLVATVSRRLVQRLLAGKSAPSEGHGPDGQSTTARLRRSIALEVGIAVVVLGMTALLVNAVPARDALAQPFATEARAGPKVIVDISVEPAKSGPLDLHLYTLSDAGAPVAVAALDASLTLRDADIGPLIVPLVRAGPNHFASYGFDLPVAGRWVLSLVVEEGAGRRAGAEVTLPIR